MAGWGSRKQEQEIMGTIREMSSLYQYMSNDDLRRLRGRKYLRKQKLLTQPDGWWLQAELLTLEGHLRRIDAELAARAAQERMF
jgi:hypothetical protein